METTWLVWLILASILGFVIAIIMIENSPPAMKEEKHWTPKACEIAPNQKWFTKY
jgi:hypothetical protein